MVTVAKIPYDTKMCLFAEEKTKIWKKAQKQARKNLSITQVEAGKVALNEVIISNNNEQRTTNK